MGSFRLSKRLPSSSLLSESWAGTTVTGRPVVAHVRREPWAKQAGFGARYAGSGRGWQGLRQAGIVPLVEVGQANGAAWVVEEFVEGETLRQVLTAAATLRSPIGPAEATALALQVTRGLGALQRLLPPLHHGDVSPSTIVLSNDGEARLGQVGLAPAHDADSGLGPARSELACLSPEELTGPSTAASDVFRVGLVALELMTGRTLFSGQSHAEVAARAEKYPGLTPQHFPSFPPAIAALLAQALAKHPADRPTVGDLEASLTRALEGGDPTAIATQLFERLFKGRPLLLKGLEGGEALVLTPLAGGTSGSNPVLNVGGTNADGSVTLAKVSTKRMTTDEMARVKADEAAQAAKAAAAEWSARHAGEEGNPKDFALGPLLIERQQLSVEHADVALQQAQSFGSTLFSALTFLGHLDEDEGLPVAAELLKQRFLTGKQLLELNLGANASLIPRDVAEQWQVVPLKSEAGGLTVAIADPTRLEVLDEVKRRSRARSLIAVRATERTLTEGLLRVYEGKTELPDWARPKPKPLAALDLDALPELSSLPPIDDLGIPPPPGMLSMDDEPPTVPSLPPLPSAPLPPLPPMPSAPSPARAPMSSPPMPRPLPSAPTQSPSANGLPAVGATSQALEVASRLFDAVLSLVPERGPEGSRMIGFTRAVARQSGASGVPLEQVRLCAKALVIAALLEGKRAFETPSLPAVSAVLGQHWKDFEPFVTPLLDGATTAPSDPRAVVLSLTFGVASELGLVPANLEEARPALARFSSYPPAAMAALEVVLSR